MRPVEVLCWVGCVYNIGCLWLMFMMLLRLFVTCLLVNNSHSCCRETVRVDGQWFCDQVAAPCNRSRIIPLHIGLNWVKILISGQKKWKKYSYSLRYSSLFSENGGNHTVISYSKNINSIALNKLNCRIIYTTHDMKIS